MEKEINALEVRKHFGKILDDVSVQKVTYLVTKNGRGVMVLLDVKSYEDLKAGSHAGGGDSFIETYSRERIQAFFRENKLEQAEPHDVVS